MMDPMARTSMDPLEVCGKLLALRKFPATFDAEIAEHLGLNVDSMRATLSRNKSRLTEAQQRECEIYKPPTKLTIPSPDELVWRFANQTPEQIYDRFAQTIRKWWTAITNGIAVPPDMLECLKAHGITDTIRQVGKEWHVSIGPLSIEVKDEEHAHVMDMAVRLWSETEEIPESGWGKVKMRCLGIRAVLENMKAPGTTAKAHSDLATALRKYEEPLGFPQKGLKDAAEYMRWAIEDAELYAAENGWKETAVCGTCGTEIPVYLGLYRSVVEFWQWCNKVMAGDLSGLKALEVAREGLKKWGESPFLQRQLRDLGLAWNETLLKHLVAIHNEHPDVLTKEKCYEIASDVMQLSMAAFDERVPISPLHRVADTENGPVVTEAAI